MSEKVTIKTLFNVLEEIERGAKYKTRTADNIADKQVKEIINRGTEVAIASGIAKGATIAVSSAAIGTGAATVIGTATAAGTTVITSGAIAGLTAGASSAAVGAGMGATAGSVVPVVGTAIGLGVGAVVGIFVGKGMKNKNENEKQRLMQEVIAKQNGIINQLKKEKEDLEKENMRTQQQNKRYEYIIGMLMTFKDIQGLCTT